MAGLIGTIFVLAAAVAVIYLIEPRTRVDSQFLATMSADSRDAFLGGPEEEARHLGRRSRVQWFDGVGKERKPFPGDPVDEIEIAPNGARLSCRSTDPSADKVYYLDGRLAHEGHATLIYWSSLDPKYSYKVGVLFLAVHSLSHDESKRRMTGTWTGFSGSRQICGGDVKWQQISTI